MARRASSNLHPGLIIGCIVVVVIATFVGSRFIGKKSGGFSSLPKLNVEEFLANGNSLRDSEFIVEGTVDEKFVRPSSRNQIVSVRVKSQGNTEMIPIELPPEFSKMNIEREQRYAFKVRFRDGGIAVTTGIERL